MEAHEWESNVLNFSNLLFIRQFSFESESGGKFGLLKITQHAFYLRNLIHSFACNPEHTHTHSCILAEAHSTHMRMQEHVQRYVWAF